MKFENYSDIGIYNKKYVFGLHADFWHRAPKALGMFHDKSRDCIACYVNEVTFVNHLRTRAGWHWEANL